MVEHDVARTCVKQVPGLLKKVPLEPGTINLDIGGGKYDLGTDFLAEKGVRNLVFDPYNRPDYHNENIRIWLMENRVDSVTISNVFCVLEDKSEWQKILEMAYVALKIGGSVYICCYDGDKSGVGKVTSVGTFQHNQKLPFYLPEVKSVFANAKITKGYIVATKEGI